MITEPLAGEVAGPGATSGVKYEPPAKAKAPGFFTEARAYLLLLLILGVVLSRGFTHGEPYYFNDETRHVMNGAFVRDFLADRPFADPMEYAFAYYAKYPATALPHWPPLFALMEGILFLVVGIHVWVVRLLVLCFALMGAYYWYRIAERLGPIHRAWLSSFIFCLLPIMQLYSSVIMLEVPLLGMTLGAIYYWLRFRESGLSRHLWLLAAFSVASFLSSQKAIFLAVFMGLAFLFGGPYRLLARRDVWAALAVSFALVVPWYVLSFRTLSVGLDRAVGLGVVTFAQRWLPHLSFYPRLVPEQLGWPLTALAAAGMGWALLRAPKRNGFLLLWVASCYVCFSLIWEKDIRHTLVWIPPLVYFALQAVEILFARRRWSLVVSGALALTILVEAVRFDLPRMQGVSDVARFVLSQPESDVLYYQGSLNGSFIFAVRQLDPEKRRVVARSKQVAATRIQYAKMPILRTSDEVIDMLRRWHIRYVLVENRERLPELGVVYRALANGPFELLRVFPIRSEDPEFEQRRIFVYRFTADFLSDSEPVVIPMMILRNREIRVDLKNLAGAPWPR